MSEDAEGTALRARESWHDHHFGSVPGARDEIEWASSACAAQIALIRSAPSFLISSNQVLSRMYPQPRL